MYDNEKNSIISKSLMCRIIAIAFPILVQGIVFQLQSLTDKAFLGNIDLVYISALGAAQLPFNTTLDSLVAICTGIVIIVSQLYGMGNRQDINKYMKSAMFYLWIISSLLFVIWSIFSENIFHLLSVDKEIIKYSIQYVRICSVYFLFLGVDASLQAMLQGYGNTKPIMIAGIIKVVSNILLSYILIFGHMGFPALFITGAAIGTLIANILSCLYLMAYCFFYKKEEYGLLADKTGWKNIKAFHKIFRLGVPTGMEFFLWNASNLVLVRFLNGFSYKATAIYTLTFGIEVVFYAFLNASSKATMTLMGQSIGAKQKKQADQLLNNCLLLNILIVILSILVFRIFPAQILGLFTKDNKIIQEAVPFLGFTGLILLPKSFNAVLGNGIRAYGDTKWMFYSQIIGSAFVILFSCILINILHFEIIAVYITIFIDEVIRVIINYCYYATHYLLLPDTNEIPLP